MDLANYLAILRRRKFVIGVVALVSTLVVALVSLSTSPIYRATVTLRVDDGWLLLEVRDDGSGIERDGDSGNGLGKMHERARILGGTLELLAAERGGTLVRLRVPWSDRGSS